MWHLSDAWARRNEPNALLVHYDNLSADLEGQVRWLAGQLGIAVPEQAWPSLVQAATFENMAARADTLVPLPESSRATPPSSPGSLGEGRQILQRRGGRRLLRSRSPAGAGRHAHLASLGRDHAVPRVR